MREIKALVVLVSLQALVACSLDFDQFGQPKGKAKPDAGEHGDGGVAQAGDPCTDAGSRSCPGHASRDTLVCRDGKWQAGTRCAADERCDSRDGEDVGKCVTIPNECKDREPSESFCVANAVRSCDVDLVAFDDVACGAFGTCMQGTSEATCSCKSGHTHAANGSCDATAGDAGDDGGGSGGTGSSGKGGGGSGGGGTSGKAPVVSVVFPVPGLTDLDSISVRGSVSDADGDAISKLTINGAAAKVKSDGSFSVTAPLALGKHALAVHVEDDSGAKDDSNGPAIERLGYMFEQASDMVLDSANKRVIAIDGATDAVVAISLDDGSRKVIVPAQKTLVGRGSLDLDAANQRVIVAETNPAALAWIDLGTGKRTVISDASHGAGVAMMPHAVLLDPMNASRAFVTAVGNDDTFNSDVVLAVDLASGDRTKLSKGGTSPTMSYGTGIDIAYDQARSRLIVVSSNGLIAVSLADGTLTTVASTSQTITHGVPLFNPWHMSVDGDRGIVLGEDQADGRLCVYEVDFVTHKVSELAALVLGSDPVPPSRTEGSSPMVFEPATGQALVLDSTGRLLRARLTPGDRAYISNGVHGNGPSFNEPISIAQDTTRKRWVIADEALAAIYAVDEASGNRTLISDATHGSGSPFGTLNAVATRIDSTNDEIIAIEYAKAWTIDPVSGDRTLLSGGGVGNGIDLSGSTDLALDGTRALVTGCFGMPCGAQVLAIDFATGNRSVVSAQGTGTGALPPMGDPFTGIVARNGHFLLASATMLLDMDPATGNRTVISDATTGGGPSLQGIQGLCLDTSEDRAIGLDQNGNPFAIDLVNGDRSPLTDLTMTSQGPAPTFLADTLADATTHRLIVAEGWNESTSGLISVLLADRKRTMISAQGDSDWFADATVMDSEEGVLYAAMQPPADVGPVGLIESLVPGTGKRTVLVKSSDAANAALGLYLDADGHRLLALNANDTDSALVAIDLKTLAQTVLSSATVGSGLSWAGAFDVAWDAAHDRTLLAATGLKAILAISGSGERTLLSGTGAGTGADWQYPWKMALDVAGNRLFVPDQSQIVDVDLETGDRTPFTGNGAGSGPDLGRVVPVVLDSERGRVITLDVGNGTVGPALIAVALSDGKRSVLAPLPHRWISTFTFLVPLAFDTKTQIAYLGALHALDTISGQQIQIAGTVK